MSNVLVIHPKDETTSMLERVYFDKGYDVITDPGVSKETLVKEISRHDKIILLGHGLPGGLIDPRVKYDRSLLYTSKLYLIDDSYADILRTKEVVSIWCYSDQYFRRNNIPGFHTGMIISEPREAYYILGRCELSDRELLENMYLFADVIHDCIELSPNEMKDYVLAHYTGNDEITRYNRNNIIVL